MKIFDCTTYFNEPLLFELRLNILDKHIDEFIVAEALYTHSGEEKKINFNKELYPKFKERIKHIVVENQPKNLIDINETNKQDNSVFRLNAAKRIEFQRNCLSSFFSAENANDWVIYSDSDEIPNLDQFEIKKTKKKIILFNQSIFHYKFNLILPDFDWFGSKACKVKNLSSISELRNIKPKKYKWWRIDTVFHKDKFKNLQIIPNGGWHFTELKTPKEIFIKHKNDEHHDEFDLTGINEKDIEQMVKNRYIPYDHSADQRDLKKKWNKKNRISLLKISDDKLPKYLIKNKIKYNEWFD
jgi:beta-1,4-mannosyl-glycoprotein beta-1,4-N-acetylglucosaminyltransferase